MHIVKAAKADLARIIALRRRAFLRAAPSFYSPTEVQNLLADYDPDQLLTMIADARLFICRQDGDLLGTSGWDGDQLRHLYVDPDAFNRGIGSALLAHTVADYQARTRHATISANVIRYARGFYEKCGFRVVREDRAWDGSAYFAMQRSIVTDPS